MPGWLRFGYGVTAASAIGLAKIAPLNPIVLEAPAAMKPSEPGTPPRGSHRLRPFLLAQD
jgi:hypothetical protein